MKNLFTKFYARMHSTFTFWDYGFLKMYGAIAGLVLGAYFPEFVKNNLIWLVAIFLILLFRYSYLLFFKKIKI